MLRTATHCPAGHEMTPENWCGVNLANTHGQCRTCRAARQRARGGKYYECRECMRKFGTAYTSPYCDARCAGKARARRLLEARRGIEDRQTDRTIAILTLCDAREKCATWWEREAIDRKLQELRA